MRYALLTLALTALAHAALAPAKEGGRAHLLTPLSLGAAPGTPIHVRWTVDMPDGRGGREPVGCSFVRLLSRTGAPSTEGSNEHSSPGRCAAVVRVPEGGIGGVRAGLHGRACAATCRRADAIYPIDNNPFTSSGGVTCDVGLLRMTLTRFARAYNRGDLKALDTLFSRERFGWYSSPAPGVRLRDEASTRESLIAYFRRRHRAGDRLSIVSFRFNGYARGRDLGHFELSAQRRADDFRGGRWFELVGKGALDCSAPPATIAVLSLGSPD